MLSLAFEWLFFHCDHARLRAILTGDCDLGGLGSPYPTFQDLESSVFSLRPSSRDGIVQAVLRAETSEFVSCSYLETDLCSFLENAVMACTDGEQPLIHVAENPQEASALAVRKDLPIQQRENMNKNRLLIIAVLVLVALHPATKHLTIHAGSLVFTTK